MNPNTGLYFYETPKVLLVSPIHVRPEIKERVPDDRLADQVEESKQFYKCYRMAAEKWGVKMLDAAKFAEAGEFDCVHMTAESHQRLGTAIAEELKSGFFAEN